jgi:hypothetical protein
MTGNNLTIDQAYDLLISWSSSLVGMAKQRSISITDVNQMKADVLTEVVAAVGYVENAVREGRRR